MDDISLVDVHAHLADLNSLSEDLQQAREEKVVGVIAVGVDADSNSKTLRIAEDNPSYVYPALGLHPWEINEERVDQNLSFIRNHIDECVALGEIGLDYKVKVKKDLQWRVFGELLDIACEYNKPVIVHCRFSHHRALEMVKERGIRRAVFHWYSGPLELLEKILEADYFISATPALTYSPPHQAAIRRAPLERILLETDTPVSYQGKEASPKDVHISLREVARIKELDPSIVAQETTANASRFFGIPFVGL